MSLEDFIRKYIAPPKADSPNAEELIAAATLPKDADGLFRPRGLPQNFIERYCEKVGNEFVRLSDEAIEQLSKIRQDNKGRPYLPCVLLSFISIVAFAAEPTVSVTAQQRYPWNGIVDVACTVGNVTAGKNKVTVSAMDVEAGTNVAVTTLAKDGRAIINSVFSAMSGSNVWVWNAAADLNDNYLTERMQVSVSVVPYTYTVKFNANGGTGTMENESFSYGTAQALKANAFTRSGYTFKGWSTKSTGSAVYTDKQSVSNLSGTDGATVNLYAVRSSRLYMVIDLSGGSSAASYPVSYLDAVPSGGWTDTYKTTKLVFRKINAGSYKMQNTYAVTLTKAFYIGVFPVTQKQWQLVVGNRPSSYSSTEWESHPVEMVNWGTIRGVASTYNWPKVKTVASTSFIGLLRSRTGIDFDLPTEAQWEYACRAGKTTDYNNGTSCTAANMAKVGRSLDTGSGTSKVGSYVANTWGLYDMHGNVWEMCLDWYGTSLSGATDPVGPTSGTYRVGRGGSFDSYYNMCTSSYRYTMSTTNGNDDGFRLSYTVK